MSNSLQWTRPVWEFEYDTREAYISNPSSTNTAQDRDEEGHNHFEMPARSNVGISWPPSSPLNATFWHLLTSKMLNDSEFSTSPPRTSELLRLYELYESKSSSHPDRRGSGVADNPEQKICFMRAGSGYLGRYCKEKYGGLDARSQRERYFEVR